jgi:endogenous inhibitor of DNA gyrase (YacG/DUF329 family)
MTIKCPICRKPAEHTSPEFPFCSERCRLIDLGKWSSEEYVISTPIRPEAQGKADEGTDADHER